MSARDPNYRGYLGPLDARKDPFYERAINLVRQHTRVTIALLQGELLLGYNRAARLLEKMEEKGLVSRPEKGGSRRVLAFDEPLASLPERTRCPDGLHRHYTVLKAETGAPAEGEFFVLRLDAGCKDDAHLTACRHAALAYADAIEPHRAELAADIRARYQSAVHQPNGAGASPDDIRRAGWNVAVHNDYRLNGIDHTFWLFTKSGRCVKGDGRNDLEALNNVRRKLALSDLTGA